MDRPPAQRVIRAFVVIGLAALILAFSIVFPQLPTSPEPVLAQTVPQVAFLSESLDLRDDSGTTNISVQLNITTTNTVRVSFRSVRGTAVPISDYVEVSGLLTFAPGVRTQTIAVTIVNNPVYTPPPPKFFDIELLNPENATLGFPNRIRINIIETGSPPAATATPGGPILLDAYEPNNTFAQATTVSVGASICNATFWPVGDVDYYRFFAKAGSRYRVRTFNLSAGVDTVLTVYNPQGNEIGRNDDFGPVGTLASQVEFTAVADGFYFAFLQNKDPSDPAGRTYCLEVTEIAQPSPTPSQTPMPGADSCEFNSTLEYACTIGIGVVYSMTFVPTLGSAQDTDFFRLWMKAGLQYTCETLNLSPYTDTNMIFLDQNGNDFWPNLGNDDREPGDRSSLLSIRAPYTGYLSVVVGPVNPPRYEESGLHTYDLLCTEQAVTPTPTSTATSVPAPAQPGPGGPSAATPTPFTDATIFPTPTPIDFDAIFRTLTPAPPPIVQIQPLATATPSAGGQRLVTINVTLFYDSNNNFMPELTEGIVDAAVALYANNTGQLLAFGYTNEAGMIRFDGITATGPLRLFVPFLNYSQVVVGDESNILIRVAPRPLPVIIP
jgi:hypothetical protein